VPVLRPSFAAPCYTQMSSMPELLIAAIYGFWFGRLALHAGRNVMQQPADLSSGRQAGRDRATLPWGRSQVSGKSLDGEGIL